jgi:PAS domain S-box-containing protein
MEPADLPPGPGPTQRLRHDDPGTLQAIVDAAAEAFGVNTAAVIVRDGTERHYLAACGTPPDALAWKLAFGAFAMSRTAGFVVEDATLEPRFAEDPMVGGGEGGLRFYAGAPLVVPDGAAHGVLCVLSHEPSTAPAAAMRLLPVLARHVVAELELRRRDELHREELAARDRAGAAYRSAHELRSAPGLTEGRVRDLVYGFLDDAPIRASVQDLDGRVLYANQRFHDWSASGDAPPDNNDRTLVPAELAPQVLAGDHFVAETGEAWKAELVAAAQSGESLTIRVDKFPIRLDGAGPQGIGTIWTDLTEFIQVGRALRESQQQFQDLAENLDEVLLVFQPEPRKILYASPSIERVLLITPQDATRISAFGSAVYPDDRGVFVEMFSARSKMRGEFRSYLPDGRLRYFRFSSAPVPSRDGAIDRIVCSLVDVTDQKLAEQALVAARDEAQSASRAKDQFLSRTSHELRTPLNAILGFGQLLQRQALTEVQSDWVRHVLVAGRHLLQVITDVLDLGQVSSGEIQLTLETVSVAASVAAVLSLLEPVAAARGTRLHDLTTGSDGQPSRVVVQADARRLKQILTNLISNAIKYTPSGSEVRVEVEDRESAVRLLVTDNGPGIDSVDQTRLFEPFERLAATSSNIEGTGLGLALCRELAHAMGGQVGLTTTPGSGSTFWVEVKAAPQQRIAAPPAAQQRRTSDAGCSVLVIDDTPANLALISMVLADRDEITVLIAANGAEGLAAAREHAPQLILLDLHLPDMAGEQVLAQLRSDPATASTTVVVQSADADPRQATRLRALGADDYLTKPLDLDRLIALVDAVVQSGRPLPD